MGYSIIIGEARTCNQCGDYDEHPHYSIDEVTDPRAPADGSPTDRTNERWPSYGAWSDFTTETNLRDLFWNETTGIMREHPGCYPLTGDHAWTIRKAAEDYEFMLQRTHSTDTYQLGRLRWLDWWVRWALDNCEHPSIRNG